MSKNSYLVTMQSIILSEKNRENHESRNPISDLQQAEIEEQDEEFTLTPAAASQACARMYSLTRALRVQINNNNYYYYYMHYYYNIIIIIIIMLIIILISAWLCTLKLLIEKVLSLTHWLFFGLHKSQYNTFSWTQGSAQNKNSVCINDSLLIPLCT